MSRSWYIQHDGNTRGPITSTQLKQLAENHKITPRTPIRAEEDGDWISASTLKGLFPSTESAALRREPSSAAPRRETSPAALRRETPSAAPRRELPSVRKTQSKRSGKRTQSPVSLIHSVSVRFVAFMIPASSLGHLIYLYTHFGDQLSRGRQPVSWFVAVFGLVIFGIPCAVICYKGPMTGQAASQSRTKAMLQIFFGVGAIVVGIIVNVAVNLLGGGRIAFLWFGVFGVAVISVALGLLGFLSGRDLFGEMGEKNTKKKKR